MPEHLAYAGARGLAARQAMGFEDIRKLARYGQKRIQGLHGILENHRQSHGTQRIEARLRSTEQFHAVEADAASRAG